MVRYTGLNICIELIVAVMLCAFYSYVVLLVFVFCRVIGI